MDTKLINSTEAKSSKLMVFIQCSAGLLVLLPQGLHLLLGTVILEFLQNAFPTENIDSFLPFIEHLIDHCLLNAIIVLLLRFLREVGII